MVRLRPSSSARIWLFALGYFACYAPYSAVTKSLTDGSLSGMERPLSGFELLPITVLASVVGMVVFLSAMRWWKHASHIELFGLRLPHPTQWTFLSGLATASIIGTTTLAYTFDGVSIVFVMLLMRGGVLVMAPVVDALTGRRTRWFSWVGLGLSLTALVVAFAEKGGYEITVVCGIDVAVYIASYFVRLRFMSKLAKSEDRSQNIRFFVEEQMVASPMLALGLGALALMGTGPISNELSVGFTELWALPVLPQALLVGLLSQGTGVFGGLILLEPAENTYSVPVNRCSSILAGVLASYGVMFVLGGSGPSHHQLAGAGLIVLAVGVLAVPTLRERRAEP